MDEQEARDRRSSAINKTVLFYGSAVGRGERRRREETGAETRPPCGVRSRNRAPRRDRRGACGVLGCATSKEHVANVASLFLAPKQRSMAKGGFGELKDINDISGTWLLDSTRILFYISNNTGSSNKVYDMLDK